MLDKVFVGVRVSKLDTGTPPQPVSRVTLKVDGSNAYTAGDDTGRVIEKSLPWATQAMAESVLRSLRGVTYLPFSGEDALLDPAAEIGDGVTAGGVYSTLAKADIIFDGLYSADIAAPGGDEVEDEYPYRSKAQRQSARELAKIRSSIIKTAESITLRVENEIDGLRGQLQLTADSLTAEIYNSMDALNAKIELTASSLTTEINNTRDGLNSKIEQTASSLTTEINNTRDGLNSKIEQTASSLTSQISSLDGSVSLISQKLDNIRLSVTNGEYSSFFELTMNGATLSAGYIELRGMVTFSDLAGNAGTIIDGGAIKTNTLFLDSLYGDNIYLRDAGGRIGAEFRVGGASSASDRCEMWTRAMFFYADQGDIYLTSNGGYVTLDAAYGVTSHADLYPGRANFYTCGTYDFPWRDVYSMDGTISASDRRGKKDIDYDMDRYSGLFDRLRPCSFLRTDGTSRRRHHGFIAQEVRAALEAEGMTGKDFAGYVEWQDGEKSGCGLRYEEMMAMAVYKIQKLESRVKKLEGGLTS